MESGIIRSLEVKYMKAKLPYDFEADYHEMVREGADVLTNGNKTEFVRQAIQAYYNHAMREKGE